jgi:hypothetical protein
MTMTSNRAPGVFWHRMPMACGTVRHKLYLDGVETPFFIDYASSRAHYAHGYKVGLWGAGMAETTRLSYRIAAFLGGFARLELAKYKAEQMAMQSLAP